MRMVPVPPFVYVPVPTLRARHLQVRFSLYRLSNCWRPIRLVRSDRADHCKVCRLSISPYVLTDLFVRDKLRRGGKGRDSRFTALSYKGQRMCNVTLREQRGVVCKVQHDTVLFEDA